MNEQIAETLREEIKTGKVRAGDKLPSVRAIAERFGVAAGTATKALQLLTKWGLVTPDSTRGYFVSAQALDAREKPTPSPEFTAIMREIESVREHLERLDERLRRVEGAEGKS
ncbi:putative HTH-type transcriptional regulator YjiR [Streptomyces aurantiacus JA 4570]|uniref:Putative HTH-type transcriptional regulator YjiR n=1 Tax=Streptomyces aurantiacus JA 4570 TaxID=1286094 RepID=S4AYE0_9ACTN|nr:putative HTH-type transcriptional regulator YjiR [Streptomyces aurantiacus JA 4570]